MPRKTNGKKIRKSRDFRDISKTSGANVRPLDNYPEKHHNDFRTVIFSVKKFFAENRIFSIFAKKSDKKFVFLEMKGILQKRKTSWIFQRRVHGNQTEIVTCAISG